MSADHPQHRVEDIRLLTGKGHFVDDLNAPNQAYMGSVLSPFAHAKIKRIDFSKVRSSPEFLASLTGEELLKEGVQPVAQNPWPPQKHAKRYHLAVGKVRFAGEPVAAILVRHKEVLEDLLEQVEVEYEPLPAITTIEQAKENKVHLYDDWKDNISQTNEVKYGNAESAISSAAHVIHVREGIRRQEAAPIEPHAVLVSYDKAQDHFEVYSTVQSVHTLQNLLATELNMPRHQFHVKVMDVGGGFGSKGGPSYPWPPLACLFAKKTGFPVKWTASRTEEFLEAAAGRDEYCELTLACDQKGRIVALKARVECDVGVSGTQTHMPSMTLWTMPGPYKIPCSDLHVIAYVTNKMPIGPVRGAGAPEGCYFMERAIEVMAREIGLDPIEFRRRNAGSGKKKGSEDYVMLLDTLAKSSKYDQLLQWRKELHNSFEKGSGSPVIVGIGISARGSSEPEEEEESEGEGFFGGKEDEKAEEGEAAGSTWQQNSDNKKNASEESSSNDDSARNTWFMTETAKVVLHKDGELTVFTGSSPHGQGHETTFAQLASEELGLPIERVRVVWGDTDLVPFGVGTFGSRSAVVGGSAVVDASRKLRSQLLQRASRHLAIDEKSLELKNGNLFTKGSESPLISLQQLLQKLDGGGELLANSKLVLDTVTHSNAVQLCVLTLDSETGKVKIAKYVVVEDAGRMINKAIVEGQLEGGVIHGIGGALLEQLGYDEQGNLLTSTFMDYSIPTSLDSPNIEIFHKVTPAPTSLDGAKGVGESGTIAAYAAVINALNDALSQVRKGAQLNLAPALPEYVFASLTK